MKPLEAIRTDRHRPGDWHYAEATLKAIADATTLRVLKVLAVEPFGVKTIAMLAELNPGQTHAVLLELVEAGLVLDWAKSWYKLTDRGHEAQRAAARLTG